jgi:hypothetical protein
MALGADDADVRTRAEDQASAIVAGRAGQVLGQHTVLKEDVFPLMQSRRLQQCIPGAPNFRGIRGFNVYGVGMSTVQVRGRGRPPWGGGLAGREGGEAAGRGGCWRCPLWARKGGGGGGF